MENNKESTIKIKVKSIQQKKKQRKWGICKLKVRVKKEEKK